MRQIYILFFSFFISIPAIAKVDFKNCKAFIDRTNQNAMMTQFRFPFEVNDQGEIIYEMPAYNRKDLEENLREYKLKDQNGTVHTFVVSKEDGQIDQVSYLADFPEVPDEVKKYMSPQELNSLPDESYTTIQFSIENGKCMPSWADISTAYPTDYTESFSFDTQLCRDIQEYFEDHKEQKSCFDIESNENKEMLTLFKDAGYDSNKIIQSHWFQTPQNTNYAQSIEQRIITSHPDIVRAPAHYTPEHKKELQQLVGSSPLLSGHRILMDCYEKGLKSSLNDAEIWEQTLAPASNSQSDQATVDAE